MRRAFSRAGKSLFSLGASSLIWLSCASAVTAEIARASQAGSNPKQGRVETGSKPLTQQQIQGLVAGGVDSRRLALLVDSRGIDFVPTAQFLKGMKSAGVSDVLIEALTNARHPGAETAKAPASAAPGTSAPTPGPAASQPARLSPAMEQQVERDMSRATDLNQRQAWPQAESIYRSVLKLDPNSPAAHVGLGAALMGEKRWDEAVLEYREVLRLDSHNQVAHRQLARAFTEKHNWQDAAVEYSAALSLEPGDAALYKSYGDALYAKGDLNHAISAYQAAQSLKPDDATIGTSLGIALYASGDLDGALAALRGSARLVPGDPEVHNAIGDVLLNKGDRRGALEEYHRAFELAPDNSTFGSSYGAISKKLSAGAGTSDGAKPASESRAP